MNIPKNYPVELIKLIHEYKTPIRVLGEFFVDWQLLASYRYGQEQIDEESKQKVARLIGNKVSELVEGNVWEDQGDERGRRYYAELYAMKEGDFLDLLYFAYSEGFSAASKNINYKVKDE